MDFEFREGKGLPRLAWLAVLKSGEPSVRVVHGPWVETRDRFFVEGAWNGAFSEGVFADSLMLMGSGAIAEGDSIQFCSASHPLERLFLLRDGSNLLVSPSLVFLLSASGCRPDLNHISYQADLLGFQRGLRSHVGELPMAEGRRVLVVHFRNVRVGPGLDVQILPKMAPPHFRDFSSYKTFLVDSLKAFAENARAPERGVRYSPLATISSGYDSAACAALALEIGCKDAVTIRSARSDGGSGSDLDDSGFAIARALGLDSREFERDSYRSLESLPEAEFVACGDLGQDVPMVAMEDALAGRFVLTGEHGDTMWSRHWDLRKDKKGARDIVRPDCAGCSVVEFRMRVGFIHVPLPCVAATSIPDLKRISQSDEMRPWTLFTSYDRPIARRLVEERGVDRHLFGQRKKAVTVLLNRVPRLRAFMNPSSYASFRAYYEQHAQERSHPKQALYEVMFRLYRLYEFAFGKVNRALSRIGSPWGVPCPVPARFRQPPGEPSFLFHWGVATIRDRYAGAGLANGPDEPRMERSGGDGSAGSGGSGQ